MLTGIWPFQGKNMVDVRHAVLHAAPKALAEARPEPAPPRLQQILDRALAKEPRDRYQKIDVMRDELRAVFNEISGGSAQQPGDVTTISAPRHLSGANPVARAVRWLKRGLSSSGGSGAESHTSASLTSTPHTSQDVHLTPTSIGEKKKSVAILDRKSVV